MRNLAPDILRQRLLIEAKYRKNPVTKSDVEQFLRDLPKILNLRIYTDPVVYSPGGEGKEINQGYDGFVALIDSGIAIYVWENAKFVSVVIYTCKNFDPDAAVKFTKDFFDISDVEVMPF
jgi:S-adenosylmethionine/arginine decarboxylase-like enzyme